MEAVSKVDDIKIFKLTKFCRRFSATFDHFRNEINPKTRLSCIDGELLKTGKFIYSEKVKLNYTRAESFCADLGLQVLMPQSTEENDQPEFWNNTHTNTLI